MGWPSSPPPQHRRKLVFLAGLISAEPGGQPLPVAPAGTALEYGSRATGCDRQELPAESRHPPSPSFSLVFPKPVMKQDLPVWNRWPCMGRQAGRT